MRQCYSCMQFVPGDRAQVCPHCGQPLEWSCDTTRFLRPGSLLQNKFVVGKVLGAGGFGNTYIGWNRILQCKVAIKEYFPKHLSDRIPSGGEVTVSGTVNQQRFRTGLLQFLEEARSIATLQDVKGVVQVYNFFEENGTGYIIMEYLEGMDVKTILKHRGQRMDYEWSRRVILTVLHTLREVHKRGILHRDIAPDNIFVTNEGVIKLIDFGAAKHATALANMHTDIVLKAGYAPIEQYSKKTQQGPYTDLYAVAAMFYRMLTGVKPQPANERITEDKLQSLSELGVTIPRQAEYAIMICLNVMPQYRLQSAQDFMEALDGQNFVPVYEPEWILPEVEEKETLGTRLHKMSPWKKVLAIAGLVLVIGTAAFGTVTAISTMRTEKKEKVYSAEDMLPQYESKTETEAIEDLKKYSLTPEITYQYNLDRTENTVIEMQPSAGTQISSIDSVQLTVESSQKLTMPDLTGMTVSQLQSTLIDLCKSKYQKNMLSYNYTTDDTAKDTCYAQSKKGDMQVDELVQFRTQISWGKERDFQAEMPNLKGMTVDQARKTLQRRGITSKVHVLRRVVNDVAKGKVLSQNIAAGRTLNINKADRVNYNVPAKIEVTLSDGPTRTLAPKPEKKQTATPHVTSVPKKTKKGNGFSDEHDMRSDVVIEN